MKRLEASKKALSLLGGLASSSVGSWKLYEEADPSIDTLLNREGFHYSPIESDLNAEGIFDVSKTSGGLAKFNFIQGPSIKRLLPSLEDISDELDNNSSSSGSSLSLDENFYRDFQVSDAVFIVDIKHWPPAANQKNGGLIVKMELVIKNQSTKKGLVIQNTISNLMSELSFANRYRYLLVEKNSSSWTIKNAYSGADSWIFSGSNQSQKYHFSGLSGLNLAIEHNNFCKKTTTSPNCPEYKGMPASSYRYTAIWQPDPSANQSLFEPIKITSQGTDTTFGDVWGNAQAKNSLEFDYFYKDKKWFRITFSTSNNDRIKNFFTPLFNDKNKKGKWVPLEGFCNSWSKARKTRDLKWKDFCYSK